MRCAAAFFSAGVWGVSVEVLVEGVEVLVDWVERVALGVAWAFFAASSSAC